MTRNLFTPEDIAAFAPSEKIGLVATVNDSGEPHVSLYTTLSALGEDKLTIGEFSRGLGKVHMKARPRVGFLVMGLDKRIWRGLATWKTLAKEGPEYVAYNRQPMFRYNTYFGINTVHYLDLAEVEGPADLPMGRVVLASVSTLLKARGARHSRSLAVLPPVALGIIDELASLNFLSFIDKDGWPRIVPVIQARSAGSSRIVFTPGPWAKDIAAIPEGSRTALFSMNLGMESFLARGCFTRRHDGLCVIDLDYLYNSAPPAHGQVYPHLSLEARTTP